MCARDEARILNLTLTMIVTPREDPSITLDLSSARRPQQEGRLTSGEKSNFNRDTCRTVIVWTSAEALPERVQADSAPCAQNSAVLRAVLHSRELKLQRCARRRCGTPIGSPPRSPRGTDCVGHLPDGGRPACPGRRAQSARRSGSQPRPLQRGSRDVPRAGCSHRPRGLSARTHLEQICVTVRRNQVRIAPVQYLSHGARRRGHVVARLNPAAR